MKRLLIGGFAVGAMLFAVSGVAGANTATPQAAPSIINLSAATTTSSVTGGSWPLATNPGSVAVSFATPASTEHISGYAVTCTAPQKDTLGNAMVNPPVVATFAVDPATGTSADPDYSNTAGTTTLQVGPYDLVKPGVNPATVLPGLAAYDHLGELPPLQCKVVASNAGGASKAGLPNKAVAPSPSGDCSPDGTSTITGLENVLGGGGPTSLYPVIGDNNDPPVADSSVLAAPIAVPHSATQFSFVLADLSGLGGPPQVPFCTTNETYDPHLLSDQSTVFTSSVSTIAAKIGVGAHPAQIKVAALKLTAPVKSTSTLTVAAGAATLYVYDSVHFSIASCPSSATVTCVTNSAAIVAGGAPAPPAGMSYFALITNNAATVLPGKPIVSAPGTVTFQKTGASGTPAAFFLMFGGAQTTISVGAAPGVPVQVAPPGVVISSLSSGATDGGDTNYTTPVLTVLSSLF